MFDAFTFTKFSSSLPKILGKVSSLGKLNIFLDKVMLRHNHSLESVGIYWILYTDKF